MKEILPEHGSHKKFSSNAMARLLGKLFSPLSDWLFATHVLQCCIIASFLLPSKETVDNSDIHRVKGNDATAVIVPPRIAWPSLGASN